MKLYRNILTVEAGILIEKGLLSLPNYYKMSNRGKIDVVRRGCKNTPALVRYDSLPVNIQQKLNPDKKNLYDAVRNDLLESHISHDARISDFFSFEYKLAGGRNLPAKKQTEYYYNALVLNAVNEIISAKRNIKAAQGSQFKINWEGISNSVNEIDRTKYPHNLPASLWGIKKAIEKYNREGLPGLINGRFGNKNTVKLKDELQEGVLFELLKHNVDDVLVCKLYNHKAAQEQWQRITTGTVSNWRTKWELELHAVRYGSNSFFNKVAMQHKRKRPEYPLYYWTMDGWDAELYYQETKIDKNGHSITTYNNRATIVIVLDASINYPIGYAIGRRENGELIKEAMKNAVNHTAQLFGKRYSPQQLQSDRFGVKGIASLAGSGYTKWYTPAKAGNAKSKVVEPYNKYLNNTYCRLFPNWSGYGVKTSNERQPNAELVNMNKKAFPDFEGLVKQLEQCITFERGKKLEQYLQLFSAMPQEQHLPMSAEKYLLMFGQYSSERQLRGGNNGKIEMKGNGLILTIGTKKYTYDCFDVEFRRNMFVQWDVVYDVDDMSRAVAVNEDGTRRFMLEEKYVQPMARVESSHGDMTQFDRVNQYNDQLKEHIIDFHAKMESSVNKIGAPQLIESLFAGGDGDQFTTATESDKLLITDSTGSHKNNKYAERLAVTRHEAEKQAAKEIRKQQKSFADERREYLRQKVNLLEYL